jgi:hypothetical protein
MSRFMAVHTLPSTREEVMASGDQLSKLPPGILWKRTYCDFTSHKFFCEWEAPAKAALEALFKAITTPFEAIYQVELIDIETRKFR